ncbi:LysR family transcriptional regulator [Granulicella sibirica]|uniref:LysR family transcriptional regulator n=1 Tax=Granulicella sibirica TaxID=2479048 RepID=UPI001008EDFD|nr:LysR family transcriptional regulator [Granulicella sibirica]
MHSIEFRHLRYFVAVFGHQSFTRAAGKLYVSQSAISKGIRELEDRLGTPLFFRHSDRVSPTASGLQLFDYAQPILELHEESLQELRRMHGREPRDLLVGCETAADKRIVAIAERVYHKLYPTSGVKTVFAPTEQILERLASGKIDAAIVTLPSAEPATRVVTLAQERMLVCMRSDDTLAASSAIEASQITGRLRVFQPVGAHSKAHLNLMKFLEREGVDTGAPLFASSINGQFEMVEAGLGLTLVREHSDIPKGLVTRPFSRLKWTLDTALLYLPSLRSRSTSVWAMRLERTLKRKPFHVSRSPPRS